MSLESIKDAIFAHVVDDAVIDGDVIVPPLAVNDMSNEWDWWGLTARTEKPNVLVFGLYGYDYIDDIYTYRVDRDTGRVEGFSFYDDEVNGKVFFVVGDNKNLLDLIRETLERVHKDVQSYGEDPFLDLEAIFADPRWTLD